MRVQFPTGSLNAYEQFVHTLADAITARDWVYDPSFALASDSSVYEKVMRDPVAAHAIRFRRHLVAGAEVRVEPASEAPEDKAAASVVEDLLAQIHGFTDARIRLAEAIFRGSAYAYVEGRHEVRQAGLLGDARSAPPPARWWVPTRLVDVDRRRFRLVRARDGELRWELWSVARRAWEPLEHPEWFVRHVHDECEASLGYGRGLLDTLYYFQAAKSRLVQDALAAAERFGQGFIVAAVENMRGPDGRPVAGDQRGGAAVAQAWQDELAKQRARHVLVHDARDKLSVLQGIGEGHQLVMSLLSYLDNAQVTTVLGATLPTLEGDGGSRAMATVQENSTESLVQADRQRLAEDLTRDLVGLVWRLNEQQIRRQVGGRPDMPRLRIDQRKREDPSEAAQVIAAMLDRGVPLRTDEVYRKLGFTPPAPGDETVTTTQGQQGGGLPDLSTLLQRNGAMA